jgi:hypothetical protein
MPVKSVIVHPLPGSDLESGSQTVRGYAWSGFGAIARVEVSADDGRTWRDAAITAEAGPLAWVQWEARWDAAPGTAVLKARATDTRTLTQPQTPAWNAKGYQMNGIHAVPVTVR